jgi:hypothetical protein
MEDEKLRELAEARLRQWPVQGSDYATAHSYLGAGGVAKVLTEASVPLQQALKLNPDGLHTWTLDTVLREAVQRTDLGWLVQSENGPEFKPAPRAKSE